MAVSKRHTELRNMAIRWICNRSFKRCGLPEANIVGYIADYVTIAGMWNAYHSRYAEHSGLKKKCSVPEFSPGGGYTYVERGDIDRWYVCVFEVKVSRSDFLNTFGNKSTPHSEARMKPIGTAHWVVAERDICKPEELPDFWGLLIPYGAGLTEKKMPKLNILPDHILHAIGFDMLWLTQNYRQKDFEQMMNMADKIQLLHRAILKGRPIGELVGLSRQAKEACCGL